MEGRGLYLGEAPRRLSEHKHDLRDALVGGKAQGGGAGVNISPVAFLIVKGDTVKLLPVAPPANTTVDRVVELVPEMFDKVTGFIDQKKAEDKSGF